MLTDEQYQWLARQVYWVEKKRKDSEYQLVPGEQYYYNRFQQNIGQFQVLRALDNPQNGLVFRLPIFNIQRMMVASLF